MKTFETAILLILFPVVLLANDRFNKAASSIVCAENHIKAFYQDTTGKISNYYMEGQGKKSPPKAIIIAIIPGAIIRGAGHIYIKRYKTAALLFTLSAIPIAIALSNPYGTTEEAGNFYALLFFGPWIYDIIASPIICHRLNKMAKHSSLTPYFQKNCKNKNEIGIKYSYVF